MPKEDKAARHRIGAVAKMLHMPVATLRVWERRYNISQAALSPSGQRLYSAQDVQRLTLLKQLTDLGHAISSLAALDVRQLLEVAATHAAAQRGTRTASTATEQSITTAWRVAVVGRTLIGRLQRPKVLQHLRRPLVVLGPFDNVSQASKTLREVPLDALLVHEPTLQPEWLEDLLVGAPELKDTPKAVLYGFAAESTCESLAKAGVGLLREPQNDTVLAQWLQNMLSAQGMSRGGFADPSQNRQDTLPPRRWAEAALQEFASSTSSIACECPRHLAELVIELSQFENYSAQCAARNPDAALIHDHLWRVTAWARAQFEEALACVAQQEGLALPPESAQHEQSRESSGQTSTLR